MKFFNIFMFLCLFVLFVCPNFTKAQWSGDPAVNTPVCNTVDIQFISDLAADGEGGAFVAFSSSNILYVQHIVDGFTMWGDSAGICLSPGSESAYTAQVIPDDSGGAIVIWDDYRNFQRELYAQRITAQGTLMWGDSGLVLPTQGNTNEWFSIASDRHSGVIVAFIDNVNYNNDIYGLRVAADGSLPWGDSDIPICTAIGSQINPAVCTDSLGNAIITWQDGRGADNDIYAQRVSLSGGFSWAGNGIAVCAESQKQSHPFIMPGGRNDALIAWYDVRNGVQQLFAQKIDSAGGALWSAGGVAVYSGSVSIYNSQVCADGNGGLILCWENTSGDIVAQRMRADGSAAWTENGVKVFNNSFYAAHYPVIVNDGKEGAIISWWGIRVNSEDIYGQRVDSTGSIQWDANGVPICTAQRKQDGCLIATDGESGAIVAWNDNRVYGKSDIYASRVLANGTLTFIHNGSHIIASSPRLHQNYPNPFNPFTTISYYLPHPGKIRISIFDISGRKVAVLKNGFETSGRHTLRWDATDMASGIYFYTLKQGDILLTKKMALIE